MSPLLKLCNLYDTRSNRRSVDSTGDGSTEVIGFGTHHLYLMRIVDGEHVVRRIVAPPGIPAEWNGDVILFLSPDGSLISLVDQYDGSPTRWLLPLDGATDLWIEVPGYVPGEEPGYIFFVPGTGAAND